MLEMVSGAKGTGLIDLSSPTGAADNLRSSTAADSPDVSPMLGYRPD